MLYFPSELGYNKGVIERKTQVLPLGYLQQLIIFPLIIYGSGADRKGSAPGSYFFYYHEIFFELTKKISVSRGRHRRSPYGRDGGFSLFRAPFRAHRYRSARNSPFSFTLSIKRRGQKAKAWFCLLRGDYRNRARSPLFIRAESFRQQGSRKSQRSEIFGKRRSGARMRTLPLGAK